jgi:hypothetical protein
MNTVEWAELMHAFNFVGVPYLGVTGRVTLLVNFCPTEGDQTLFISTLNSKHLFSGKEMALPLLKNNHSFLIVNC